MSDFKAEGVLIPFYHYPSLNDSKIEQLIKLKSRYPACEVIAIINPNNGIFEKEQFNFSKMILDLHRGGVECIGYLYTGFGKRDLEDIKSNIYAWKRVYKKYGIEGIFVDEVKCDERLFYKEVAKEVRRFFQRVVMNPGTRCSEELFGDIVVCHENSAQSFVTPTHSKSAYLAYGIERLELDKASLMDFVYITERSGSNPWEELSGYLEEIMQRIDFHNSLNKKRIKSQLQSDK